MNFTHSSHGNSTRNEEIRQRCVFVFNRPVRVRHARCGICWRSTSSTFTPQKLRLTECPWREKLRTAINSPQSVPNGVQYFCLLSNSRESRRMKWNDKCANSGRFSADNWLWQMLYQYYDVKYAQHVNSLKGTEENRWAWRPMFDKFPETFPLRCRRRQLRWKVLLMLSPFLRSMMFQFILPVDSINLRRFTIVWVFRNKLSSPFTPLLRLHHHHAPDACHRSASFYCYRFIVL